MRDAFDTVTSAIVRQLQTDQDNSRTAADSQAQHQSNFVMASGTDLLCGFAAPFAGNGLEAGTADPGMIDYSSLEALLLEPMRDLDDPYSSDFLLNT